MFSYSLIRSVILIMLLNSFLYKTGLWFMLSCAVSKEYLEAQGTASSNEIKAHTSTV